MTVDVRSERLVKVDVAVWNEVAVMVAVEIPIRVLRVESALADCAETANRAAIETLYFMIKGMPNHEIRGRIRKGIEE